MKIPKMTNTNANFLQILKGSNSPCITAIDTYLMTIGEDRSRRHGWNHPSAFHQCLRSQYYDRVGKIPNNSVIAPRVRRIFENGQDVHDRLQLFLTKAGILLQDEAPIFSSDLEVLGNTDGIIKLGKGLGVLEIKSINHCDFIKLVEPKPEHIRQVSIYMYVLEDIRSHLCADLPTYKEDLRKEYLSQLAPSLTEKQRERRLEGFDKLLNLLEEYKEYPITQCSVLYENKNNQDLKEFIIDWNWNIMNEIESTYNALNCYVEEGQLPPKGIGFNCSRCAFKEYCMEDEKNGKTS